jgi:hypothetical protein
LLVPKAFYSGEGMLGLANAIGSGAIIGTASAGLTGANASQTALGGLLGAVGGGAGYGTSLASKAAWKVLDKALPGWFTTADHIIEWTLGGGEIEAWPHFASAMAAMNGGFSGGRSIYNFQDGSGLLAFAADSSWSLDDTTRGNILQFLGSNYDSSLSVGQNRTVYEDGFYLNGFAHTEGNVTINLSQAAGSYNHEGVHILQSRLAGPVYTDTYIMLTAVGGLVGVGAWIVENAGGHRKDFGNEVMWYGYYENFWELIAYGQNWDAHEAHKP